MKRSALPLVVLLLLSAHESHGADPLEDFPDPAEGQHLFHEARALMQIGRYFEACSKLEHSLRIDRRIATQFVLADCNEHIGNVTSAWAGFIEVAGRAKAAKEVEREKTAGKRARALEPRLPKLIIEVSNAPECVQVTRDGVVIEQAAWGTAIPVDPGTHHLSVVTPGKPRWVTNVQCAEAQTTYIKVLRDPASVDDCRRPLATNYE